MASVTGIGAAPLPGEHTEEVLKGVLNMSETELQQLRPDEVIKAPQQHDQRDGAVAALRATLW